MTTLKDRKVFDSFADVLTGQSVDRVQVTRLDARGEPRADFAFKMSNNTALIIKNVELRLCELRDATPTSQGIEAAEGQLLSLDDAGVG